jgi:TonB family protein
MRRELAVAWAAMAKVIAAAPLRNGREPEIDQPAPIEIYIDDDGLASGSAGPGSGSVRPPLFQRHLKPLYPEVAARLGIEATVELTAVFRADGQVDQVELQRWAGFGLDESAVATVRQLRFEPATQDGRPVSFRGLVRYNFRRPTPQAIRNSARSREEIDRLKRSLQDLLKTRPVP